MSLILPQRGRIRQAAAGGGGGSVTIEHVGNDPATYNPSGNTATPQWASHPVGSLGPTDIGVVAFFFEKGGGTTVSSIDYDGNAMTQAVSSLTGSTGVGLWAVTGITTGATANIDMTLAATINDICISVFKISGASSATPAETASFWQVGGTSISDTLDTADGAAVIAAAVQRNGSLTLGTPTGFTDDVYSVDGVTVSTAFYAAAGKYLNDTGGDLNGRTYTIDWNNSATAEMVCASWL